MYQKSEFVLPDRQTHVGDIHETDKGRVSVYINTWFKKRGEKEDNVMIDFRRYYLNKEGNWLPTGKGFSIPYDKENISSLSLVLGKLKATIGGVSTTDPTPARQVKPSQAVMSKSSKPSSLESSFVVNNDDIEDDLGVDGLDTDGIDDLDDLDDVEELDDEDEDLITKLDSIPAKTRLIKTQSTTAKSTSPLPQRTQRMVKKPIRKTGFSRLKAED